MKDHLPQIRRLTQILIASGALNLILIAICAYAYLREMPKPPYLELKPFRQETQPLILSTTTHQLIENFKKMPLDQLKMKLQNAALIEQGLTQRDIALAVLVASHHFDLKRALLGESQWLQKREATLSHGETIAFFPGLSDSQFQSILLFAHREKWPFTSQGLFLALKEHREEATLKDTFYLTPQFLAIEMLFSRSEKPIPKKEILELILEGDWQYIAQFFERQHRLLNLSPAKLREFLLSYVEKNSKTAAKILLETNTPSTKLDAALCCQNIKPLLLTDSNTIVTKSTFPSPTGSKILPVFRTRQYVVQEGDSLWKIAKRFRVNVDALKAQNQLESDFLKPGTTLKIP